MKRNLSQILKNNFKFGWAVFPDYKLEVLKLLLETGALLLTTNYDVLLDRYCDMRRICRSNQDDIFRFWRGDLDGIFHVHGNCHDPYDVFWTQQITTRSCIRTKCRACSRRWELLDEERDAMRILLSPERLCLLKFVIRYDQ
jgi:hypothetical protein